MTNSFSTNHHEPKAKVHLDIAGAVSKILISLGEDTAREGLAQTPERVARRYAELTTGYHVDLPSLVNGAIFHENYTEMAVVRDIDFASLCEHHLLPFFGKVDVAYIPDGRIIGLSKLPRIVEMFAKRLQIQERMTIEIADTIQHPLEPKGVAVIVEASHLCSMIRGVEKVNAQMITRAMLGAFADDTDTRHEFISHLGHRDKDDTRSGHDYHHEENLLQ